MAPLTLTTADAVDRETAWLRTSGDGLPALLESAGGPFTVVQAYLQRVVPAEARSLYVMRRTFRDVRIGSQRRLTRHSMLLRIAWPAVDGDGAVEADQRQLDQAVDKVVQRVRGTLGDKTHGGRFLSVAEGPDDLTATWTDPARTLPDMGVLLVDITYSADDPELIG